MCCNARAVQTCTSINVHAFIEATLRVHLTCRIYQNGIPGLRHRNFRKFADPKAKASASPMGARQVLQ